MRTTNYHYSKKQLKKKINEKKWDPPHPPPRKKNHTLKNKIFILLHTRLLLMYEGGVKYKDIKYM